MRMLTIALAATLASTAAAVTVSGQSRTIPGEMITLTATVEAVQTQGRTVTLKKPDGTYVTLSVPQSVERFDGIKVGDTVTARYYDNIVFRKLNPGEKPVDEATGGVTGTSGTRPGAIAAAQRTITTTITAIDPKIPSITFTGPNNWVYSGKINDASVLKEVKVGDQVNITWTEAVSLVVSETKK